MNRIRLGTVVCIAAVLGAAIAAQAQTFTAITDFNGVNGYSANALSQAANGNLVGTTLYGGTGPGGTSGTVFEITPTGGLTTIHNFCSQANCLDGEWPNGPLLLASDGNYYGTAQVGGPFNYGTVFKITPEGQLSTVYNFCSLAGCADGARPIGALLEGRNGNLYGITMEGGSAPKRNCTSSSDGCGTIFEVSTSGTLTTLYSFCSERYCADGVGTGAVLTLGTDGNFYGTTQSNGSSGSILFRLSPTGKFGTLLNFCTQTNCIVQSPLGVIEGNDGNLYGTSGAGGAYRSGVVFRISPSGELTTLYSFCALSKCADGSGPDAGLMQGSDGNFYGTTMWGGAAGCIVGCGTIFRITPAGALTTLYDFCSQQGCVDGGEPTALLVQRTDGTFYGTTQIGGDSSCNSNDFPAGCGTVFNLSTGLGPFVRANPAFGKIGRTIGILGNDLTGTSSVTFNGVAATAFTVLADTFIKATVPSGATTGAIQVTTPSGTLSSNAPFQVLP